MPETARHARLARSKALVLLAAVGIALGVSACGSSSGSSSATATNASASSSQSSNSAVAAAQSKLNALYKGVTFHQPPATAPKPEPGKKIWLIDVSLEVTEGAEVASAVKQAGKAMGWDVTVFNGQFTAARYLEGIRQAISAKADGIFLYAIDCATVKAGLEEAKAAGIEVAAAESADCNVTGSGPKLFNGEVSYTQGTFEQWAGAAGAADADWIIAKTDGHAKVLSFWETDTASTNAINEGFEREMKTCGTCEIVSTLKILGSELGPTLENRAAQALLQNPTVNTVMVPYDALVTGGIGAAVMSSGRSQSLQVVAGGGSNANMELIRHEQGENAGYGTSLEWEGYAGMDALNRLFHGEEPKPSGIGMQVFDAEHGVPASGAWKPVIDDFAARYEQAWKEGKG